MKKKRFFLRAMALALSALPWLAAAQDFKAPIRLIVPYGAGGSTDAMARAVAPTLSKELGQPVLIENKPGANGQIGTQFVKTAPGDGTVFLFTLDHSVVIVPFVTPNVNYSAKDFQNVGKVGRFQWVFATPRSGPATTLPEFIKAAQRDPGLRNFGVPIVGGVPQIMGDAFAQKADVAMTVVPFAGAAPLMPQLMGGQLASGIVGVGEALSMSKSGKVRLLGISGAKRSSILPEVPTFEELGLPGVKLGTLYSVFAPKTLPRSMAERMNAALRLAVKDPQVVHSAREMSIELESSTLEESQREIVDVANFWERALKPR
jgi:tripartite-type tricarboxylate transporter receptor subunit TctC